MKKRIYGVMALLLAVMLLVGCGANKATMDSAPAESAPNGGSYGYDNKYSYSADDAEIQMEMEAPTMDSADGGGFVGTSAQSKPASMSEKIIYTARTNVETINFDDSVDTVYKMVEEYGGFFESSYVTGADYVTEFYGDQTFRRAEFVIRIPSEKFKGFKNDLDRIGSVTDISSNAQNITTQYYDVQARITAYRTQEQTLLNMMEKATTVSEMIEIESALSEVRYNIEAHESTIRNWDAQVNYSTVTVIIREVQKLTRQVPVQRTYWQEISDGFVSSLESIGQFFKGLFKWFVSNLPVIVIFAACLAAALIVIKKKISVSADKIVRKKLDRRGKKNETVSKPDSEEENRE